MCFKDTEIWGLAVNHIIINKCETTPKTNQSDIEFEYQ